MFASLKNKIKEETGSDLAKLAPILSSPPQKSSASYKHSRRGSGSSIGSLSVDSFHEDIAVSNNSLSSQNQVTALRRSDKRDEEWKRLLQRKEDEHRKQLEKMEEEWKKQIECKQEEWKMSLELLQNEKSVLEEEKMEVVKQKLALEESLKAAEEYKKKIYQYQEDLDQLEGFQAQEMAKIKHLLLQVEQENAEKSDALKESTSQVESLKLEVNRLQRFEEQLSSMQDDLEALRHSSDRTRAHLSSELARSEEEARHLRDRVNLLEQRHGSEVITTDTEGRVKALLEERALLESKLEETHVHLADIKTSWSEKIAALETQVGRLSRQAGEEGLERRRVEGERDALLGRIRALEVLLEQSRTNIKRKEEALQRAEGECSNLAEQLKLLNEKVKIVEDTKSDMELQVNESLSQLKEYEKQLSELQAQCSEKEAAVEVEKMRSTSFEEKIIELSRSLEKEVARSAELISKVDTAGLEKDEMLLRNAQINQQMELAKQELRDQSLELSELHTKVTSLEENLISKDKALEDNSLKLGKLSARLQILEALEFDNDMHIRQEQELKTKLTDLEDQITEKNKTIRNLQQRLGDMKKTLQKELRNPTTPQESSCDQDSASNRQKQSQSLNPDDDVNFKYLKHVLIKFLTSREYEAQHLTRAVATLLHFSPEEERLLRETLEWKMSWFGTRPSLGYGQTAKTIPPS